MLTFPHRLSSTRRKRAIPEEWSTAEALQAFEPIDTINSFAPGSQFLSVDSTTDLLLCGSADGIASVYSLSRKEVLYTKDCKGGAVLDGVFWNDRAVIALSSGSLKVFDEAEEVASLDKHKGPAIAIDLHPCGDLVVSIGADKSFILYDLTTSSVITQVHCDKGSRVQIFDIYLRLTDVCYSPYSSKFPSGWPSPCRRYFLG